MPNATGCTDAPATSVTTDPCSRCDVILGIPQVHVETVVRTDWLLTLTVSTPWQLMGCPRCGVVAPSRGRRVRQLHDVPGIDPVRLVWRQRIWRCPDPGCTTGMFVEQVPALVARRGSITTRAIEWAIEQLRHQHATVQGLARRLGWRGRHCGARSNRAWKNWPMTPYASMVWSALGSTNTSGITLTLAVAGPKNSPEWSI